MIQMLELSTKEFKAVLIIKHHTLKTNSLEMNGKIEFINKEKNILKNKNFRIKKYNKSSFKFTVWAQQKNRDSGGRNQ